MHSSICSDSFVFCLYFCILAYTWLLCKIAVLWSTNCRHPFIIFIHIYLLSSRYEVYCRCLLVEIHRDADLTYHYNACFKSSTTGRLEWHFSTVLFKLILVTDGWGICEIALRWITGYWYWYVRFGSGDGLKSSRIIAQRYGERFHELQLQIIKFESTNHVTCIHCPSHDTYLGSWVPQYIAVMQHTQTELKSSLY